MVFWSKSVKAKSPSHMPAPDLAPAPMSSSADIAEPDKGQGQDVDKTAPPQLAATNRSIDLAPYRAALAACVIILAVLVGLPLQWLSVTLKLPSARWIPVLFHRIGCKALGVRVSVKGACVRDGGAVLITANHISWLDIVVLGRTEPLSFIAKSEVASWPLFGLLAKLQRTIFVNRTRRSETGQATREIAERLASGDAIVLFPEGTSSDGNRVLPFRSALIGAAKTAIAGKEGSNQEQKVWVQPLSIAYTGLHGMPMGRQHRPLAAWYGDMDLLPHLWALLKEGAVDAELAYGEPIAFDAKADRKQIAKQAEDQVRLLNQQALMGRG
jgi:1-acyl-sn-glycerol-3-phosphate acyltransferase